MPTCAICKINETSLYDKGVAICIACAKIKEEQDHEDAKERLALVDGRSQTARSGSLK